jgi:hypothetical protein
LDAFDDPGSAKVAAEADKAGAETDGAGFLAAAMKPEEVAVPATMAAAVGFAGAAVTDDDEAPLVAPDFMGIIDDGTEYPEEAGADGAVVVEGA